MIRLPFPRPAPQDDPSPLPPRRQRRSRARASMARPLPQSKPPGSSPPSVRTFCPRLPTPLQGGARGGAPGRRARRWRRSIRWWSGRWRTWPPPCSATACDRMWAREGLSLHSRFTLHAHCKGVCAAAAAARRCRAAPPRRGRANLLYSPRLACLAQLRPPWRARLPRLLSSKHF